MSSKKNLFLKISMSVSLFFTMAVYAEDITIMTENFPSETDKVSENKIGGIAGEIITKALEAKKIQ